MSENENGQPEGAAEADVLADLEAQLGDLNEVVSKEQELLHDLQRLQAEFVNYKARVERDRDVARNSAIAEVLRALFPAFDDLARAEAHGDLEGSPFEAVANKLRAAGDKFGLKPFGAKGDIFNPELHEALMQTPSADVTEMTVADVIEPGYQIGERVVRAAKVVVHIPA
jgi:molecular chaperone GrpE